MEAVELFECSTRVSSHILALLDSAEPFIHLLESAAVRTDISNLSLFACNICCAFQDVHATCLSKVPKEKITR